jgi:hypothetical protein
VRRVRVVDDRIRRSDRARQPVSVDCGLRAPGPGAVDSVLADIEGFAITPICPSEALSSRAN